MQQSMIDKLMDMSQRNAEHIAELWYQSLNTNSRTNACKTLPKAGCMRHAMTIYKSLGEMYFADNCFQTVEDVLDAGGFVEDFFARGVPLEEVLYMLVLLRRHIWLYADSQALFTSETDMYNAIDSINRVLLVFDYAAFIVARKYGELAKQAENRRLSATLPVK